MKQIIINRYDKNGLLLFGGWWNSLYNACGSNHGFMYLIDLNSSVLSVRGVCDHFNNK